MEKQKEQEKERVGRLDLKTKFIIRRFADDKAFVEDRPYSVSEFESNVGLNTGSQEALKLIATTGGTQWNNANAQTGVGDSATAEDPTQTDLLAAVNKTYKAMDATFPSIGGAVNTVLTAQSTYIGTDANYLWTEFVFRNGATALKCLIRKMSNQGTKTSGQTWQLTIQITMS